MATRVFLGGLAPHTRERDVERFFRKYGKIRETAIKSGFAFVDFEDKRDAADAIYEMNGRELLGEKVSVERARGTPRGNDQRSRGRRSFSGRTQRTQRYGAPTRTRFRLLVENLSSKVSWQDLKDYMRQAGEVTFADAHKKRRNEGVVEFASNKDMYEAMDRLNYSELQGRKIKLIRDRGGDRRSKSSSQSSSRSRSGSRSRSRSRSRRHSRSPRSSSRSTRNESPSEKPKPEKETSE